MGARRFNVNFDMYMAVTIRCKVSGITTEEKQRLCHIAKHLYALIREEEKSIQIRTVSNGDYSQERT